MVQRYVAGFTLRHWLNGPGCSATAVRNHLVKVGVSLRHTVFPAGSGQRALIKDRRSLDLCVEVGPTMNVRKPMQAGSLDKAREDETTADAVIAHYGATGRWHQALDQAMVRLDHYEEDSLPAVRHLLMLGRLLLAANRPSTARYYLERARGIVLDHEWYVTEDPELAIGLATALHTSGSPTTRRLLDVALALLVDVDDEAAARVRLLIATTTDGAKPYEITRQPASSALALSGDGNRFVLPPSGSALRPLTYRLLADAQEALGRLDEIVHRSPLRSLWARSVQTREIQRSAHLDGVHVALREVLLAYLPGVKSGQAAESDLARYVRSTDLVLSDSTSAGGELLQEMTAAATDARAGDGRHRSSHDQASRNKVVRRLLAWTRQENSLPMLARLAIATCYLQVSDMLDAHAGHLGRLYLGAELVRGGLLRAPWFPLSTWIDTHHELYQEQVAQVAATGRVDPFIEFFARGVVNICRSELALLDDLCRLRERLLAALPARRSGRIRNVVTAVATVPMINNRYIIDHENITMRSATDITAALVDHGQVVVMGGARYGRVFCCAEALQMLVKPDAT